MYHVDPMALRAACTPWTTFAVLPHTETPPVDAQTSIFQLETAGDGKNVRSRPTPRLVPLVTHWRHYGNGSCRNERVQNQTDGRLEVICIPRLRQKLNPAVRAGAPRTG